MALTTRIFFCGSFLFLAEHGGGFFGGGEEGVDFFWGVVGGDGGADGAGGAEESHEGLAAVMASADGDAHLVKEGAEVVVVNAVDVKGEGPVAVFVVLRAVEGDAVDVGEALGGLGEELVFVSGDFF